MEYTNTDWNHIVMTANSTDTTNAADNVTIYWNSSNINAGGAGITHVPNTKSDFYIGGEPVVEPSGGNFKGILDDTRIYNSIITSDDVGLLYGAGGNALEITFDETGNLVFTNDSGTLTETQITELLDTTDTATGDASITFDGDTTLELSGSQLDGIETTTDGVLTESTVSFWIKPTDDTFAQENVIIDYFATIGYTVTILPNGTLQFDVVDSTPVIPLQVEHISMTDGPGSWNHGAWTYKNDTSTDPNRDEYNLFIYRLHYAENGSFISGRSIQYDWTIKKWEDRGSSDPITLTETINPQFVVGADSKGTVLFTLTNPYYVA
jgi:hypothetical protein